MSIAARFVPSIYSVSRFSTAHSVNSKLAVIRTRSMSSASPSGAELGIVNSNIKTAPGVDLSAQQKVLVGSVLDLFTGNPSKKILQLWTDNASFKDPITNAEGRKQYEAQWYGLRAAFSEIELKNHNVTSAGNPITLDLTNKYKVKGVGTEKVMESVVEIHTDSAGKITSVKDKWNNELPDGAFAKFFRNLNAAVVPIAVSVPKSDEQDQKAA